MVQNLNQINYTNTELDRLALALKQDGICIIRGLFAQQLIEEWRQAFEELFQERQNRPGGLAPRDEGSRYYLTLPWIAPFANQDVFANQVILGVLERVFWQEYVMVQLGCDVPVKGSNYQEIHRDFRPLFSEQILTPAYALAVNFSLVEVTEDNGPFQMARGTHLLSRAEGLAKIASGEIPMESFYLKPGDVMVRNPFALHRGSPNQTATPRPMIVMGYVIHWLHTPKVDLTLSQDYYQSLPTQIQQMLRCQVIDRLKTDTVETYINFQY